MSLYKEQIEEIAYLHALLERAWRHIEAFESRLQESATGFAAGPSDPLATQSDEADPAIS